MQLIPSSSPQWNEYIKLAPHDVYHTAVYHRFCDEEGLGKAQLAVFGNPAKFIAWPYLVRRIEHVNHCDDGLRDLTSVYGYSGPIAVNCMNDDDFLRSALRTFTESWQSDNVVSVFTRFHPILKTHRWLEKISPVEDCAGITLDLEDIGSTVCIDLTASQKQTWSSYKPALRHRLQHGRQAGLVTTHDTEWRHIDTFAQLYHQTMHRNKATQFYYFSVGSFTHLKEALGSHVHLFVTQLKADIICSGLFFEYAGIVTAHLVGWDYNYRHLSPAKVLYDDVCSWARERGNHVFHLGGGRGGKDDDPLFVFKAEFSPLRQQYFIGRSILNSTLYRALSEERGKCAELARVANLDQGFFPAYRAPLFEEKPRQQQMGLGEGYE